MACTYVLHLHVIHKEKTQRQEFHSKVLIFDCCLVASVGGSE